MTPSLAAVTDRPSLERWLGAFDDGWEDGRFSQFLTRLPPPNHPLRREALLGLILREMAQQWQRGRRPSLEGYLHRCPELGPADALEPEVILHEMRLRERHGVPLDVAALSRRFPSSATKVLTLASAGFAPPKPPSLSETAASSIPPTLLPEDAPRRPPVEQPAAARPFVGVSDEGGLPERFGRYRIERKIGQGGMGSVYLARDVQLDRPVAIKVPHLDAADGPEGLERFYQEARAAAALDHPNICPVYEVDCIDGVPYMSMGWVDGKPLTAYVSGKQWEPRQAALLIRKLAQVLHEAHAQGVVHRDLKPANIMINKRREPIVMDFGLAQLVRPGSKRLTVAGAFMGTPAYVSPEQARGDVHLMGAGCDVYSLGVMLYEMLAGELPFQGTAAVVIGQLLYGRVTPPSQLRPGLDARLEAICLKAMSKEPAARYATAKDFADALKDWVDRNKSASAPQRGDDEVEEILEALLVEEASPKQQPGSRSRPRSPDPRKDRREDRTDAPTARKSGGRGEGQIFEATLVEQDPQARQTSGRSRTQPPEPPRSRADARGRDGVVEAFPVREEVRTRPAGGRSYRPEQPPERQGGSGYVVLIIVVVAVVLFVAAIGTCILVGLFAPRDDEQGKENRGKPDKVIGGDKNKKEWEKPVEKINAKKQAELDFERGSDFYLGRKGTPVNHEEAMKYFRKAADQGHDKAQLHVGFLYDRGLGVQQNYGEAMKWYQLSAAQGNTTSQNNVGVLYRDGLGVPQSNAEAMRWFRKSADRGDLAGMHHLGWMYEKGLGSDKNYTEALTWYRKAAEAGHAPSQNAVGYFHHNGYGVAVNHAEALRWYKKATDQNYAAAQHNTGLLYEYVYKEPQTALSWYRKAADQDYAESKAALLRFGQNK